MAEPEPISNPSVSRVAPGQISNIRETLLMMASLADRNLALAMRALVERDESSITWRRMRPSRRIAA